MIAIIDYGVGNLRSVAKAFEYLGFKAVIASDPQVVLEADHVVLPGVGAYEKSMESLAQAGMVSVVKQVIASRRPFLGICLGLQLLFEESTENFGDSTSIAKGLGIFSGRVVRFPISELKVPQIGWNQIHKIQETPFLYKVPSESFVYFVHSYYVLPEETGLTACTTDYGLEYCAGIAYGKVAAFQFHPEKSSQVGMQILKNFGELKA